jgi:hypothetical protein
VEALEILIVGEHFYLPVGNLPIGRYQL